MHKGRVVFGAMDEVVFGTAAASYVYTHEDVSKTLSPATWVSDEGHSATTANVDVERLASAPAEAIVAVAGPAELRLE